MKRLKLTGNRALLSAFLLEISALMAFYFTYRSIYQSQWEFVAKLEFVINYSSLFIGGFIAGPLAVFSMYQSIIGPGHWLAILLKVVLSFISMFCAGIFIYALLIFLALV